MKISVSSRVRKFFKILSIVCLWVSLSGLTWAGLFVNQVKTNQCETFENGVCTFSKSADQLILNGMLLIPLAMIPITAFLYRKLLSKHPKLFKIVSIPALIIGLPIIFLFIWSTVEILILGK